MDATTGELAINHFANPKGTVMKLFISHYTALTYWREHFPLDSELGIPARISTVESCATQKGDVLAFLPESWIPEGRPIDVLTFDAAARRQSAQIRCRLWGTNVPKGAFFRIGDVCASSPEFVFLQMASELSLPQLIALGCELCGTYILLPKNRQHPGAIDDHPKRVAPLTNLEKIEAFLAEAEGGKGVRKARRAIRYVAEGSRSPMETMVYMLLCLPPMLGGYGLPKATLNAQIPLNEEARAIAMRSFAEGDICWPEQRLDIEFHGEVHVGAQKMKEDVGRILGIESMDWRVITVTSPQVFDLSYFETIAKSAAAHLKWRLYPRILGDTPARRALHDELESWMFVEG